MNQTVDCIHYNDFDHWYFSSCKVDSIAELHCTLLFSTIELRLQFLSTFIYFEEWHRLRMELSF